MGRGGSKGSRSKSSGGGGGTVASRGESKISDAEMRVFRQRLKRARSGNYRTGPVK